MALNQAVVARLGEIDRGIEELSAVTRAAVEAAVPASGERQGPDHHRPEAERALLAGF